VRLERAGEQSLGKKGVRGPTCGPANVRGGPSGATWAGGLAAEGGRVGAAGEGTEPEAVGDGTWPVGDGTWPVT